MEGTMKQLIFKGVGELELTEVPIPQVGDDGVLIKIARAGICGSDIHGYTKGGRYGGIGDGSKFGHEFVGTIVEMGKNVKDFKVGDRVWADNQVCVEDARFCCMAGGFAEYITTVKTEKDKGVFLLPDSVPFSKAVLLEPFGVGVHTKNRGGAKPGMKVLMYGAGPIGLMGWTAMKYQGIDDILVAEQMPMRIEFAKKLGVNVFSNVDTPAYEKAAEVFGIANINSYERADVDLTIDYVGLGALIREYMDNGRCNSVFSTLGLDSRPLEIIPNEFMSKQFTVTGSRAFTPEDIAECIDVLEHCEIPIETIITGVFPLEEYKEAFETACDKNRGYKVVFNISD